VLRLPFARRPHQVDYLGAGLLVASVSCLLLVAVWGGTTVPWTSPLVLGLAGSGVALGTLFVLQERRLAEPILPLRLFRSRIVAVSSGTLFIVGVALFGTVVFLPLFLQAVLGASATNSGFLLLPLMMGVVVTSIVSGRVITRTGRYKAWPVGGTVLTTAGVLLLGRMDQSTGAPYASVAMAIVGLGIGMVMQVLILAVQNAVEHRDLGAATSAANFFRSIGGTFGTAALGAVFSARLGAALSALLPQGTAVRVDADALARTPEAIARLEPAVRAAVVGAIAEAVQTVFLVALPVVALGVVLALMLPEIPLRDTAYIGAASMTEAGPAEGDGRAAEGSSKVRPGPRR
jgi:predicted MFS family arabinose efflux permease